MAYNEKEYKKLYNKQHRNHIQEYKKLWYQKNKENIRLRQIERKEEIRIRHNEYLKQRRKDPLYKLETNLRNLIGQSISKRNSIGIKKKLHTEEILGCNLEDFYLYIERQFKNGMTWDSYGKWHLDHIKPISLASNEEEVYRLNHYTNFQPLWAEENIKKSNKILDLL